MSDGSVTATRGTRALRVFAWAMVVATFVFLINNYLSFSLEWPGPAAVTGDGGMLSVVQVGLYGLAVLLPLLYVMRAPDRPLRDDAASITGIVTFIVRACFWAVLFVGIADFIVSFLRVEEMLADYVGEDLASQFNFNRNRAPYVHFPMIGLAIVVASFTRTLGFHWLALLVVLAELAIVLSRFIFSYEQAFQGDLVRFWYGALFLFASAYTLLEDGHVRVDVVYAGMSKRTQGWVNAIGCLLMGILFCWVILYLGMATKSSIINAPLLSFEVSQSGFGMYVKYLMAGFLAVFAVTMMLQFSAYLLESAADARGDPGGKEHHIHGEPITPESTTEA